ncbi:macrophage receptor MARCO-like [Dysidea avara]|uniref:macrophage receptor MARCO-like n=1 Tax=Dysidea avara TaxID=196820 RepID=UPI00332506AA
MPDTEKFYITLHGVKLGSKAKAIVVIYGNDHNERVRISGGPKPSVGYAEVYYNGTWRRFCHSVWDRGSVQVFCKQLGYSGGVKSIGWSTDDVIPKIELSHYCRGDEKYILDCGHDGYNCGKSPAVVCQENVTMSYCSHETISIIRSLTSLT